MQPPYPQIQTVNTFMNPEMQGIMTLILNLATTVQGLQMEVVAVEVEVVVVTPVEGIDMEIEVEALVVIPTLTHLVPI